MNYNKENIIGVPLVFIDYNTGELRQGKFIRKKTKIQTVIRFKFKRSKLEDAIFELDYNFFNKINVMNLIDFSEMKVSGYFLYMFDQVVNTRNFSKTHTYLVFTKLEEAKKFRKKIMIPSLIDRKFQEAKKLKTEYFNLAEEIESLEKILKRL